MKKITLYITIILMASSFTDLFPQEDFPLEPMSPQRRERIESLRIWKMTEFLNLTSEQSNKFFPKLNQFERSIHEKQRMQRDLMLQIYTNITDENYKASKSEVQKYTRKLADLERQIINEKESFLNDLDEVFSPEQQLRYIIFENRFKNRLMRMLGDQNRPMRQKQERRR